MFNPSRSFKRTSLSAALAAVAAIAFGAPAVQAQVANVTLYGVVDVGITHVTGVKGGSVTALTSGIMEGSRFGIRGSEDLGGGFRAMFTLEARFEGDTGALGNRPFSGTQIPDRYVAGLPTAVQAGVNSAVGPSIGVNTSGKLFDRQAFVGLVTPVGAVLMGRQYTPAFEVIAKFDAFSLASAASPSQLASIPAGVDIRADNSVMYRLEKDGLFASSIYSFGESTAGTKRGAMYGLNAGYQTNRFGVAVGYNERKNSAGQKSLNTLALGANFNAGFANIFAMGAQIKEPNSVVGPELRAGLVGFGVPGALVDTGILPRLLSDLRLYHVGARVGLGVGTFTLGYNKLDDRRHVNADAQSYGVAYTYPLSKRTDVNLAVAQIDNSANSQILPGGNGFLGGVTAFAGKDSTAIQFSVRHKF